jgi:hypothetical protein
VFSTISLLVVNRHKDIDFLLVDGKGPCMGKAWPIMKTLEKHVLSLGDPPFSLPLELASTIESQFQRQWRMRKTDLHYP